MKLPKNLSIVLFILSSIVLQETLHAQTKRLKRPTSRVGITSVDRFVRESFDLYDKVYRYDGYHESGKALEDDDLEILIDALEDAEGVLAAAPNAVSDLDGAGVLKQGKGTLQLNRSKKALKYCIKTAKKLVSSKKQDENEGNPEVEPNDTQAAQTDTSNAPIDSDIPSGQSIDDTTPKELKVNSKFDFVPGDKLLFYDDFSSDFIGDFPSKWNTNGTGEVVTINDGAEKWFEIKAGQNTFYIPDLPGLPEEYTIEFDIMATGIDRKTSSSTVFRVILNNTDQFKWGSNAHVSIPLCQYHPVGIRVRSNKSGINNTIKADIRNVILQRPHIAIAVNKQRLRLWVDQKKYVDIPRFLPAGNELNRLRFTIPYLRDGVERLFIKNLKVAEGGLDLRRQLINEGKFSTSGILFESGSANIRQQSFGIIRQVSQALMQVPEMNLKIIGHTDSDGSDDANLQLSKKRADAVKEALISIYKISGDRLQTEGKGESEPVGDNKTTNGKAQNRRVEFIKQ